MQLPPRCPDCGNELESAMVKQPDDSYAVRFTCPNADNHGTTMDCPHGCGAQVRNPQEHYYYVPGMYGSPKWTCIPRAQVEAQAAQLSRIVRRFDQFPRTD